MKQTIHVVPAAGLKVINPDKPLGAADVYLPPEGAVVETSAYWLRRVKDGDVTLKSPAKSGQKKGADA
ncbi:DUF2635 domain-containing protein [Sneathiella sp.]|uniref:DUF2635 domain-containing protein n=1 Tax=Sneathiella sp. TaxID=1964365 RepID=UPI002FE39B10